MYEPWETGFYALGEAMAVHTCASALPGFPKAAFEAEQQPYRSSQGSTAHLENATSHQEQKACTLCSHKETVHSSGNERASMDESQSRILSTQANQSGEHSVNTIDIKSENRRGDGTLCFIYI